MPSITRERKILERRHDGTTSSENTNTDYLVNDADSLLGGYLGRNYGVFDCPAANYASAPQHALGWSHRARSVTMDAALGEGTKYDFGWSTWYVANKLADIHVPGPSDV